jgi:hypothetical protein
VLGQRIALHGQGLLPGYQSDEDRVRFDQTLRASIGSILALQRDAAQIIDASEPRIDSDLRARLTNEKQAIWDASFRAPIQTQRWSDGLMLFTPIADELVRCPPTAIFRLFALAGMLCFLGLARRQPLRGAIELSWAAELNPGELHGAAVARAYELESAVADYPRIVVGPLLVDYLSIQSRRPETHDFAGINRALATRCLGMLAEDADGHWRINFLGDDFRSAVTDSNHALLYDKALVYISGQLSEHRKTKNTRLAFRYVRLQHYFAEHPLRAHP